MKSPKFKIREMSQSTQKACYHQHDNINTWKTKLSFIKKRQLFDFKENCWQEDAQESVLATLAELAPFNSVLYIGCSAGEFLIPLSKICNHSYGIDIVQFRIAWKLLRSNYGINCQRLNLDYAHLPFEDASFDLVTMLTVLEHVFDVHHAVQEIARVLQPNGIVVIQVPNIAYLKHRLYLLMGKLPCTSDIQKIDNRTEWDGQHLHYFTLETLKSLLNQYGLQVQRVRCSGKLAKLRCLWSSLLGADLIVFAKKF